jgi:hypothetical protein
MAVLCFDCAPMVEFAPELPALRPCGDYLIRSGVYTYQIY